MESKETTVSTRYIRVLLEHAQRIGLDIDAIREELGIPEWALQTDGDFVDGSVGHALIRRLWRETQDDSLLIDPDGQRLGTFRVYCEYMLLGTTLGSFLRRGEHIQSYLSPNRQRIEVEMLDDTVRLHLHCYRGERDPESFVPTLTPILYHRLSSWAIDEKIELLAARFPFPKPAHAGLLAQFFDCTLKFDGSNAAIDFNRRYLSRKIVRSQDELKAFMDESLIQILSQPGKRKSVKSRIIVLIRKQVGDALDFPNFENMCDLLRVSPNIARRILKEEGTSYQRIKDELRLDRVNRLLEDPGVSIADIAYQVGFTEPAALSRAFKKWTNETPQQYREKKLNVARDDRG